jgi:two-component sensor histidine kinase
VKLNGLRPLTPTGRELSLAVGFVGAAFAVRWLLSFVGTNVLIFAVCYPAIMAATLMGGHRAGLIALILATLSFWWAFFPPTYSFALTTAVDATNVALFVVAGGTILWISQLYRRAMDSLQAEKAKNELLAQELNHRAKNGFAVISTIVRQSLRHDPESADKIVGRIFTLKKADELLLAGNQSPLAMKDLLQQELATYDLSRVTMSGPALTMSGELAKAFSMIVHELATNAAKYGAWSVPTGKINIHWGDADGEAYFAWEESGCAVPEALPKRGFGSVLVERLLAQHNGNANFANGHSGIRWHCTFPNAAPSS